MKKGPPDMTDNSDTDREPKRTAAVSQLPVRDGDGYGFGGDIVLTIGSQSFLLGPRDGELATELAKRWNEAEAD